MPTTFFFSRQPGLSPVPPSTGWSGISLGASSGWRLDTELGASTILTGPLISWGAATANYRQLDRQFISAPLKGNQWISGRYSGRLQVLEVATSDNVNKITVCMRLCSRSGLPFKGTGIPFTSSGSTVNEFSTAFQTRSFGSGAFLTTVSGSDGDRIVLELGYHNTTAGTTPQAQARWGSMGTILSGVRESQTDFGAPFLTLNDVNLNFYQHYNVTTVNIN